MIIIDSFPHPIILHVDTISAQSKQYRILVRGFNLEIRLLLVAGTGLTLDQIPLTPLDASHTGLGGGPAVMAEMRSPVTYDGTPGKSGALLLATITSEESPGPHPLQKAWVCGLGFHPHHKKHHLPSGEQDCSQAATAYVQRKPAQRFWLGVNRVSN